MTNGRCRIHGGLSPSGAAHPSTTHGRYSRYLPARLQGRYLEAQADPELISLREELALIDARLADVLGRVDTNEAGTLWRALAKALTAFRTAEAKGDKGAVERETAFQFIEGLVSDGNEDSAAWAEVLELVERRRKIAETETKRLQAMGQMITAERAMVLLSAVVNVIQQHVQDRTAMAAISRDIGRLVSQGAEPEA